MDNSSETLDLMDLLYRLMDNAKYIALSIFLSAVLAVLLCAGAFRHAGYTARTALFLTGTGEAALNYGDLQMADSLLNDCIAAFSNRNVQREVIEKLNLVQDAEALEQMTEVHNPESTHILTITVNATSEADAVAIAGTYAETVADFIGSRMMTPTFSVWEEAHIVGTPEDARVKCIAAMARWALVGGMAGMLLSCAATVLRTLADERVRSPKELEANAKITVFGVLTEQESSADPTGHPHPMSMEPDYVSGELLSAMCEKIITEKPTAKTIVLTGCGHGEGKSYVALRLAQTMARMGYRTACLSTDFRTQRTGIPGEVSGKYVHSLAGIFECPERICGIPGPADEEYPLSVFISDVCEFPAARLNSPAFDLLLKQLAKSYDFVLIDSPPLGLVIDAAIIAKKCDAALLVAQYAKTPLSDIAEIGGSIEKTGCRLLGCIINRVRLSDFSARRNFRRIRRMHQDRGTKDA